MKVVAIIIGVIIATLVLPTISVSASQEEDKPEQTQRYVDGERERESGFYREDGFPKDTEDRPAINPDFASCDLKLELKCIPFHSRVALIWKDIIIPSLMFVLL